MNNYQLSIDNYQLPKGYKQTEVGVIPEDWDVSSVGQEFEIQLGKMLDAAKNTGTLKPYIGNRAVQWGRFEVNDLPLMAMSRSDMERFRLEVGDLIVCEGGEVGRAAIWDAPIEECYYQKALHRLRVLNDFSPQLMMAFLKYWTDFDLLSNYISQTSIAHLTKEKLAQVPLPVPNVEEQRAIATTLSDVDALIAALDKLIAKKRHLKTAIMQQLLTGKKRLPGFSKEKGYRQTEVGVIPDDWELKTLGEIFQLGNGFSFKSEFFSLNGPIVLTPGNFMLQGGLYFNDRNTKRYSGSFPESTIFQKGDLLVVMTDLTPDCNLLGKPAFVDSEETILHNQRIGKINLLSEGIDKQFLYFLLLSSSYLKKIKEQATGSTVRHTSNKSIYSIALLIPQKLEEQHEIATALSDMDAEIAALEARRAKTQAIKQGMMQQLLTGKIRLIGGE